MLVALELNGHNSEVSTAVNSSPGMFSCMGTDKEGEEN